MQRFLNQLIEGISLSNCIKRADLVSQIISVNYTIIDLGIELTKQHLRILINPTSAVTELLFEKSHVKNEAEIVLNKKLTAQHPDSHVLNAVVARCV